MSHYIKILFQQHRIITLAIVSLVMLCSCKSYQQNILFNTDQEIIPKQAIREMADAERNYIIKKNDYLKVNVYTNKGERIIDPNNELSDNSTQSYQNKPQPVFLVGEDGGVTLPMVGKVHLAGLSLEEANLKLEKKYSEYYKGAFVITNYTNKRVIVLGAPGGQVIPLQHENMKLLEIIALAGGIGEQGKAHNIRLIRGELTNPTVYLIDLTTIDGLKKAEMNLEPGDIIYIEPVQREFTESVRDVAPVFSIISSILALIVVVQSL